MWIEIHNPFNVNELLLKSIATGLTKIEGNGINCDEAEKVAQAIQDQLDGICFAEAKIKKKDQIKTEEVLKMGAEINIGNVHVDLLLLFSMLLVFIERERGGDTKLHEIRIYRLPCITLS